MARSLLRRRGHLGFCHYERSEVIQKQVLLAMGLPRRVFYTSRNDKIRMASHGQVQGCHREESFKTTWRSVGKEIASTTPQEWLVAGSHLGFAEKSFHSIAMTRFAWQVTGKFRIVIARSLLRRRGHLGFCHYERSEVIQKQVLLARRLPRRVFYTSRNDKIRMASHRQIQDCHGERPFASWQAHI